MKRTAIVILLVLSLLCSGCCYAPGHEGSSVWEMRYDLPEWLEADYELATQSTQPQAVVAPPKPLPAPEVDLEALPDRVDSDMVNVLDYIPDLVVDLKYATTDNFTGQVIYSFTGVYLRYGTVVKLMNVQQALREKGYLLKIWDAYRPVNAQQALWDAYPDPTYVANPNTGSSSHSRGNTVDITVVDAYGVELEMPTGFDDFSTKADRDYADCTTAAAANARMLEEIMEGCGFEGYEGEWWHFSDTKDYPVEKIFDPAVISTWYADCNEYINLRATPDTKGTVVTTIPKNDRFTVLGWTDYFAYVEYKGQRGYVNDDYIGKVG